MQVQIADVGLLSICLQTLSDPEGLAVHPEWVGDEDESFTTDISFWPFLENYELILDGYQQVQKSRTKIQEREMANFHWQTM